MMEKITVEEVERLSERPNVEKIVVENFLMNMSIGGGTPANIEHLVDDAKLNKWNNETVEAILDGILKSGGLKIEDLIDHGKTSHGGIG